MGRLFGHKLIAVPMESEEIFLGGTLFRFSKEGEPVAIFCGRCGAAKSHGVPVAEIPNPKNHR